MTQWLSDKEQEAWRGLLTMTSQLEAALNRQLQDHSGLSLSDYDILVPLSESPDGRLRIFELADQLNWEQSRLSHHLARMTKRGLVQRIDCASDRRGAYVSLTPTGRDAIEQAAPEHVETVKRLVFSALTPEQVQALSDISRKVLAHTGNVPSRP
ncbi:MAG TPA: MarR family transcriptional regulator [Acidimicrobiales bacterium]|jgi:DNA-binding MarR family transcriptional regulator|nr:MarR family transcriptional regulator [Acidimicrobiales bacterium]